MTPRFAGKPLVNAAVAFLALTGSRSSAGPLKTRPDMPGNDQETTWKTHGIYPEIVPGNLGSLRHRAVKATGRQSGTKFWPKRREFYLLKPPHFFLAQALQSQAPKRTPVGPPYDGFCALRLCYGVPTLSTRQEHGGVVLLQRKE